MSDIHALSGAYAVDALDDDERNEFEQHLAVCPECRAEVASFQETTALLAGAEEEPAPPSLRESVLTGISQVRPLPPEITTRVEQHASATAVPVRRRRLPQLLAAAAAVVLLAVGTFAWHPWQHQTASLADQIVQAPDAERVIEKLPGGAGELTLVRSASLKRAVMIGDGVPEPAAGTTYQIWYQQPGQGMVSAGLMPDSHEATVLVGDAATAKVAAITVEPETGSAHPTSDPIAVFPLKASAGGNDAA
ncbi:MAG TPA: anti-sigma factor [Nocardioides sp.]|jgi:anti-sigma-K factor RskA|nr:anti-sigma factor [Nocardioides sp.]